MAHPAIESLLRKGGLALGLALAMAPAASQDARREALLRMGDPAPAALRLPPGRVGVVLVLPTDPAAAARFRPLPSGVVTAPRAGLVKSGDEALVFLFDAGGRLRRVARVSALREIEKRKEEFSDGQQTFATTCARCHGEDGNDLGYQYIKPLGGIGNRLSDAEILERFRAVPLSDGRHSVRTAILDQRRLHALVVYVAGL